MKFADKMWAQDYPDRGRSGVKTTPMYYLTVLQNTRMVVLFLCSRPQKAEIQVSHGCLLFWSPAYSYSQQISALCGGRTYDPVSSLAVTRGCPQFLAASLRSPSSSKP